jgi:hypothetical protein
MFPTFCTLSNTSEPPGLRDNTSRAKSTARSDAGEPSTGVKILSEAINHLSITPAVIMS